MRSPPRLPAMLMLLLGSQACNDGGDRDAALAACESAVQSRPCPSGWGLLHVVGGETIPYDELEDSEAVRVEHGWFLPPGDMPIAQTIERNEHCVVLCAPSEVPTRPFCIADGGCTRDDPGLTREACESFAATCPARDPSTPQDPVDPACRDDLDAQLGDSPCPSPFVPFALPHLDAAEFVPLDASDVTVFDDGYLIPAGDQRVGDVIVSTESCALGCMLERLPEQARCVSPMGCGLHAADITVEGCGSLLESCGG